MEIALLQEKLAAEHYLCGEDLALVLSLSEKLKKPLLLEGPAGVGKTDLAKSYARATGRELIRLQCYEGLDQRHALYEWNYQKQLLYLESEKGGGWQAAKTDIFSEEFLLPRPLLKAFLAEKPAVLLIDEIDKSDEEFESFLLEALSDFAVTIPERGTVAAKTIPTVFLTSNGMRDFSDGLKRRCVHYYIDYPTLEEEYAIIKAKFPKLGDALTREIATFIREARQKKLRHIPGIAEVLDWAEVLYTLGIEELNDPKVGATYHFLVKSREDGLTLTKGNNH
ncbi:MAG TPA: MoxR family ATPase [Clostridiales bacterium]|nr:MoxR family ATPase [Clostridiales bacterium]